jgi:hypothetical protein
MTTVEEIEKYKPHHLMVTVEGEEERRRVPIQAVRNRWSRVERVLGQIRWTSIECRDKTGGVLGYVQAAAEPAEAPAAVSADDGGVTVRERELMELLSAAADRAVERALQAGDRASSRIEATLRLVADAQAAQLEMMTASTRAIAAQYTEALTIQRQLTLPLPEGGDEQHGMAAIGPLLGFLSQGRAAPAPAKKTTKP